MLNSASFGTRYCKNFDSNIVYDPERRDLSLKEHKSKIFYGGNQGPRGNQLTKKPRVENLVTLSL
jgi:hypothetical protein